MAKKILKRTSDALTETTKDSTTNTTTKKVKKLKSTDTTPTKKEEKEEDAKKKEDTKKKEETKKKEDTKKKEGTKKKKDTKKEEKVEDEPLSTKVPFVKRSQVEQAIKALVDYSKKTTEKKVDQGELFADQTASNEHFLNLVISLKRINPQPKHKPIKITLSHPLYDPAISPVCLIVKDPQREYKDLLEENNIHFISKVIGIAKLKGKHSSYEARRLLMNNHALFLADERVIPTLPGLLGVKFFKTNKLPVPIDMTDVEKLRGQLERAIAHTTLRIGSGSCLTVKFGDLSRHSPEQIKDNLVDLLGQLGKKLPLGGWNNIHAVHLKTGTSASLPLWLAPLDDSENGRFNIKHTDDEIARMKAADERKEARKEKKLTKISNKLHKILPA